jgi:hypothetical protein
MEWSFEFENVSSVKKTFRGELKTRSGRVIKFNKKINCRTSNVVYAVHCKKCKHIVYVGETETMLKDRIQNHLQVKHDYRLKSGELYPFFYSCVSFCILKFPFDRAHPLLTVVFLSD